MKPKNVKRKEAVERNIKTARTIGAFEAIINTLKKLVDEGLNVDKEVDFVVNKRILSVNGVNWHIETKEWIFNEKAFDEEGRLINANIEHNSEKNCS